MLGKNTFFEALPQKISLSEKLNYISLPFHALIQCKWNHSAILLRAKYLLILLLSLRTYKKSLAAVSSLNLSADIDTDPQVPLNYITIGYLSTNLSIKDRARILINHHKFISSTLQKKAIDTIYRSDLEIFSSDVGGFSLNVSLGSPTETNKEGDLSLHLYFKNKPIYQLSFSFSPGIIFGLKESNVCFLTRMQTAKGNHELAREISSSLCEVSPQWILFSGLSGIAEALSIRAIVGISSIHQSSYKASYAEQFKTTYDNFFEALGALKIPGHLYIISLPLQLKPIELITRRHRSRTLKKRKIRDSIREGCYHGIKAHLSNFSY
ncbi:DUF535 family protein [Azospira inquinata]|uniref:DUF535 family protein n=1 Tax=Azospira inquinata TaxID=2785627 RepID=A0A975SLY4_9RHOO|nr:DUF535 family protein [Azospira inquinata]QWT45900.1 DUF535 family protein [Azospira inquinata]QWT48774.1 DUF535 family protein [Azospira inquinata]